MGILASSSLPSRRVPARLDYSPSLFDGKEDGAFLGHGKADDGLVAGLVALPVGSQHQCSLVVFACWRAAPVIGAHEKGRSMAFVVAIGDFDEVLTPVVWFEEQVNGRQRRDDSLLGDEFGAAVAFEASLEGLAVFVFPPPVGRSPVNAGSANSGRPWDCLRRRSLWRGPGTGTPTRV